MEAGLLQLRHCRRHPGGQHDAVDEVVRKLSGHHFMRQMVRVCALIEQLCRHLPDRIDGAARLQRGDRVADLPNMPLLSSWSEKAAGPDLGIIKVFVMNSEPASLASLYLSHTAWSNSARWAVPCVAETARRSI